MTDLPQSITVAISPPLDPEALDACRRRLGLMPTDYDTCPLVPPLPEAVPTITYEGALYVYDDFYEPEHCERAIPFLTAIPATLALDTTTITLLEGTYRAHIGRLQLPLPKTATSVSLRTRRVLTTAYGRFNEHVLPRVVTWHVDPLLLLPHEARALVSETHPLCAILDHEPVDLLLMERASGQILPVSDTCRAVDLYGRDLTLPMPRPAFTRVDDIGAPLQAVRMRHPQVPSDVWLTLATALPQVLATHAVERHEFTAWPPFLSLPEIVNRFDIEDRRRSRPSALIVNTLARSATLHQLAATLTGHNERSFREQLAALFADLELAVASAHLDRLAAEAMAAWNNARGMNPFRIPGPTSVPCAQGAAVTA